MARWRLLATWFALCVGAFAATARAASVCINGPSAYGGNVDDAAIDAVIALRPECVRINLRQDIWTSVTDATPRGRLGLSLLDRKSVV